jgi:hypothetical protein
MRVDHAGKDISKGQRGTSAKNDDVDVVWQMAAKEGGAFTLTAKKRRMGWVPLSVDLVMHEDNRLHFELLKGHAWPAGTVEVAAELDALGIDDQASGNAATKALKEAGHGRRTALVKAAQKYRRERSTTFHFASDLGVPEPQHPAVVEVENATREHAGWPLWTAGTTSGTTPDGIRKPPGHRPGNHFGNHREPPYGR